MGVVFNLGNQIIGHSLDSNNVYFLKFKLE